MIGKDVTFDLSLVLLIAAVALFVVALYKPLFTKHPWLVTAGLACFAGAFLADRLL